MLQAPFPYWGGKTRAAPLIWDALGAVPNFVEPFAGSLAVLLRRPHTPQIETVNDQDGFLCNFWRAVQAAPEAVAHYADAPSNECDLHARHAWLVPQRATLTARLEGDPDYYDAKIAGWWCWGLCCWIGSGWCAGTGSWHVVDGQLTHLGNARGIQRQLTHLGNARGIQRQLTHLGSPGGHGQGVQGLCGTHGDIYAWMQDLCARLRRVRVTCGDWTRVLGPSVTYKHGLTGIVLDPPYSHSERTSDLYAVEADITADVQAWCLANGNNPLLRIVLCGYDTEYALPGWRVVAWKANGGMSNQNKDRDNQNKYRERLWLSPACLEQQLPLFGGA